MCARIQIKSPLRAAGYPYGEFKTGKENKVDKFNRERQFKLLSTLADASPCSVNNEQYREMLSLFKDEDEFHANLIYLEGHGLLISGLDNDTLFIQRLRITSEGIDFILKDGGIGAIMKVMTVRLHEDTLRHLEAAIGDSAGSPEDKQKLLVQLRSLPADAIKHLHLKLLDLGLAQLPNAFHAIQTALHHL